MAEKDGPLFGADTVKEVEKTSAEVKKLQESFKDIARELKNLVKDGGTFSGVFDSLFNVSEQSLAALVEAKKLGESGDLSEKAKKEANAKINAFKATKQTVDQVEEMTQGLGQVVDKVKNFTSFLSGGAGFAVKLLGSLAAIVAVVSAAAKSIAATRKDLGVSALTAAKLEFSFRRLGAQAKLFGLDLDGDIKPAITSIVSDLGASVDEAVKLSFSFARTAAATGQSASDLSKTLSIMESISSSSREVLLNQIKTNAAMIEAAGVAPALVMKDIAENAEFFAQFAKDGGQNLVQAGIAARKLGLDMSAVSSITNSLLEFETSIEKSMEASVLLGRQINTDRARQLALVGDQAGLMKEIQRIVGGEAEFSMMNAIQRRALAESVGLNVEQLARAVRGNTAGATGAAAGGAMGDVQSKQLGALHNIADGVNTVADNTRQSKSY